MFPESLRDVALEDFYRAINDVRPSLIRVEADEATYNLHIIIRFELEQALLTGDLPAGRSAGAPGTRSTRTYLGITPPDDADGCMQDVHWSAGLVGYFPTYSLGNLYAAQLYAAAEEQSRRSRCPVRPRRVHAAARVAQQERAPARPVLHRQPNSANA